MFFVADNSDYEVRNDGLQFFAYYRGRRIGAAATRYRAEQIIALHKRDNPHGDVTVTGNDVVRDMRRKMFG